MKIESKPDLNVVLDLLRRSELPAEDLTSELLDSFYGYWNEKGFVGVIGLEIYYDNALLRSLAVDSSERGKGIGKMLVEFAERSALQKNVKSLYLLTTTAEKFFEKNGYTSIPRTEAPESIRNTTEFSVICPSNSVFMVKHLI
jgi:amino-acid N-acetyltransferase